VLRSALPRRSGGSAPTAQRCSKPRTRLTTASPYGGGAAMSPTTFRHCAPTTMQQRHRRRVPCDMGVSNPPSLQSKFQYVFIIYTVFSVVFSIVFYDCLCRRLAPTVKNSVCTGDDTLPAHRPPTHTHTPAVAEHAPPLHPPTLKR
jgi:hypothetical protein